MPEATAAECSKAFIEQWVRNFGLPGKVTSDNGVSFQANLWKDIHKQLGTIVTYSPVYSPQSVGMIERQHSDLKQDLRAVLSTLGDVYGSEWTAALPWVLLSRRTSYHSDLEATPAEVVFGENPRLPGDMPISLSQLKPINEILAKAKENAQRAPRQTRLPKHQTIFMPETTRTAMHVYTKVVKPIPLGPKWEGPYRILERMGETSIKIRKGYFTSGQPRTEIRHWRSCQPAAFEPEEDQEATAPKLGRLKRSRVQ